MDIVLYTVGMQKNPDDIDITTEAMEPTQSTSRPRLRRRLLPAVTTAVVVLLAVPALYFGYLYAASPATIRSPQLEHYHFRTQIIVDGKPVDSGNDKYQQTYAKGICSADLPEQPIHFHDKKNQMTHIHWNGITGGLVMKYYGWNYVGGPDDILGHRFDGENRFKPVNIHGKVLPKVSDTANFYVYIGDKDSYKEKSFDDWVNQNLETFFGKKSNLSKDEESAGIWNKLFPKAAAHGGHDHATEKTMDTAATNEGETPSEEELTRINNLIGNVVIFVQKNRPTDQQIKHRFNNLEPLSNSTCGG